MANQLARHELSISANAIKPFAPRTFEQRYPDSTLSIEIRPASESLAFMLSPTVASYTYPLRPVGQISPVDRKIVTNILNTREHALYNQRQIKHGRPIYEGPVTV